MNFKEINKICYQRCGKEVVQCVILGVFKHSKDQRSMYLIYCPEHNRYETVNSKVIFKDDIFYKTKKEAFIYLKEYLERNIESLEDYIEKELGRHKKKLKEIERQMNE